MICAVFLWDFAMNYMRSDPKLRDYVFRRRGWLNLSVDPRASGGLRITPLLVSRIFAGSPVGRAARGEGDADGAGRRRAPRQFAAFIAVVAALIVLTLSRVIVLQFESRSPDANIKTGAARCDELVVTITASDTATSIP